MVVRALLHRVGWYVALVVLTGAVVIAARAPWGEPAAKGRARQPEAARRP